MSRPLWLRGNFGAVFSLLVRGQGSFRQARALALIWAVALAAALGGCGSGDPDSAATATDYSRALAGAPRPLARLYARPGQLVPGGTGAFRRQLAALRGYPVVVNSWASWCGPCRFEFPFFQQQVLKRGKRVAFLAIDAQDVREDARAFLEEFPVPYPSFFDPKGDIAQALKMPRSLPITTFYDRGGEQIYVKPGGYASEAALADDVQEYAIAGARAGAAE
jgi:cytochrome c biogenesis protein CcmG/thiol:disulfide interchange protein DsbE